MNMSSPSKKVLLTKHESIERKQFYLVPVSLLKPFPGLNVRLEFDLDDLKTSIASIGVQEPLRVINDPNEGLLIINGERRWRAVNELINDGLLPPDFKIPVINEPDNLTQDQALLKSLVANEGKPFTTLERSNLYARLLGMDDPQEPTKKLSVERVAALVGRTKVHVYELLKLQQATPELKQAVADGSVTMKQAVSIIKTSPENPTAQNCAIESAKTERETTEANRVAGRKETLEAKKNSSTGKSPLNESDTKAVYKFAMKPSEVYEQLQDAISDFQQCSPEDLECRRINAGRISAFCLVLGIEEPIDTTV
jgi:ParB-like chromosome segregation protein Spo0J